MGVVKKPLHREYHRNTVKIKIGRRTYVFRTKQNIIVGTNKQIRLYSIDGVSWDSDPEKLIVAQNRIEQIIKDGTVHMAWGETQAVRRQMKSIWDLDYKKFLHYASYCNEADLTSLQAEMERANIDNPLEYFLHMEVSDPLVAGYYESFGPGTATGYSMMLKDAETLGKLTRTDVWRKKSNALQYSRRKRR